MPFPEAISSSLPNPGNDFFNGNHTSPYLNSQNVQIRILVSIILQWWFFDWGGNCPPWPPASYGHVRPVTGRTERQVTFRTRSDGGADWYWTTPGNVPPLVFASRKNRTANARNLKKIYSDTVPDAVTSHMPLLRRCSVFVVHCHRLCLAFLFFCFFFAGVFFAMQCILRGDTFIPLKPCPKPNRRKFIPQTKMAMKVNSGGYLPSRFGEVNIHRYSPTLRRIIVTIHLPAASGEKNGGNPIFSENKIAIWELLCVVHTETIIRLSVGEKRWIFTSPKRLGKYRPRFTPSTSANNSVKKMVTALPPQFLHFA